MLPACFITDLGEAMNFESLFDKIYNNRHELIRYFIAVFVCSALRLVLSPFGVLSWVLWAVLFFVLLKYFVFKDKPDNIYIVFTQIMKYTVCVTALWLLNSVFVGIFMAIFKSSAVGLSLGGALTELLCMLLMYKIVFRKK